MRWFTLLVLIDLCWCGLSVAEPPAPQAATDVALKVVKYADLIDAVKANRGKVVVVDVWAEY